MPCFADTELMHVLVKMSWNMAMDFQAVEELQRYARTALKTTMEITALRVQDIEVFSNNYFARYPYIKFFTAYFEKV